LLSGYGVDTRFVRVDGSATGQAIIQVDDAGENAIVLHGGGNAEVTVDEIDATLEAFSPGDWLVLQNEIPHIGRLIERASARGLLVCFNPAPFSADVLSLPVARVRLLTVNEIEGCQLAGLSLDTLSGPPSGRAERHRAILEGMVRRFPDSEIVLTVGGDGALYGFGDVRERGAVTDLPVVDTTGAGDTFIGYYLASRLARGLSVRDSLRMACHASSIMVSRPGAMEAIPVAAEVFA
jgi:ribokinase